MQNVSIGVAHHAGTYSSFIFSVREPGDAGTRKHQVNYKIKALDLAVKKDYRLHRFTV